MKRVKIADKHHMQSVEVYEAETIEQKVRRIVDEKEPIEDSAPIIWQEKQEGVNPAYDIRTDRWQIAINAMDSVSKANLSEYLKEGSPAKEESDEKKKDVPDSSGLESKEPAA